VKFLYEVKNVITSSLLRSLGAKIRRGGLDFGGEGRSSSGELFW